MDKCPTACDQHLKTIDKAIEGIKKTIYGEDGNAGVAGCVRKKVSWVHLGVVVFSVVTLFSGFYLYAAEKKDGKLDKVEQTAIENAQKAEVIKQDIKHIKDDMREQKSDIKEIKKDMVKKVDLDVKFELLLKAIETK